jgi:hypothetical protein
LNIAAILACEMIEDETLLALERALPREQWPPVVWIESSLHERPARLRAALQEVLDSLDEGSRAARPVQVTGIGPTAGAVEDGKGLVEVGPTGDVLLGFGYCGGGLKELVSRERRLVFPRVDDCISLFLDGGCDRGKASRDAHSYYLTKGWFCHKSALSESFDDWVARYGAERAAQIRRLMFANYERICLIETGAYDIEEWIAESRARAAELELDHSVVPGSVELLERLFAGRWDTDVIVLEPGRPLGVEHLLCFDLTT